MSLKKFEKASILQILSYLYKNYPKKTEIHITELYKNIKATSETISIGVNILKNMRLVTDEKLKTYPPQRVVALTEKGVIIAEHAFAIEQVMNTKE